MNIRQNYVKHAIRENQVLQSINHPNILAHYDSVEIDSDTFASILEFCDGGDLESYLKK